MDRKEERSAVESGLKKKKKKRCENGSQKGHSEVLQGKSLCKVRREYEEKSQVCTNWPYK